MPALNEEQAIGGVLRSLKEEGFSRIIVADNGSSDRTRAIAEQAGATVVYQARRGYGAACLAGIAALQATGDDTIVAFIDADGSDDVRDLRSLIEPLRDGRADLVIGSRTLGARERGALPRHAQLGNALATWLIRLRTGYTYSDLGPMRALHLPALQQLAMQDLDFGWTVEMQLKAALHRLRVVEVPVRYRRRIGRSKISGTLVGSARAGVKILQTIAHHGR